MTNTPKDNELPKLPQLPEIKNMLEEADRHILYLQGFEDGQKNKEAHTQKAIEESLREMLNEFHSSSLREYIEKKSASYGLEGNYEDPYREKEAILAVLDEITGVIPKATDEELEAVGWNPVVLRRNIRMKIAEIRARYGEEK